MNRVRQILDSGDDAGVSIYLVTEPSVSQYLEAGPPTDAGYLTPRFAMHGHEGHRWPGFGILRDHIVALGHAGAAWISVTPHDAARPVFAPCSWPPYDDGVARAIVQGYGGASWRRPRS